MSSGNSNEDKRPLVGVVGWLDEATWAGGAYGAPAVLIEATFIDKLTMAGADVVVLPPQNGIPRFAKNLDGIVLAGGHDVYARHYGSEDGPHSMLGDGRRDETELAFVDLALRVKVPLLAVCRGCQVVNVAAGGTLVPHVPDAFTGVAHSLKEEKGKSGFARHDVTASHPIVEEILGTRFEVKSWHHQAIDRIGEGLCPGAHSDDGLVEAIVARDHPFLVGVQWHPETHQTSELFDALVSAARTRRASSGRKRAGPMV